MPSSGKTTIGALLSEKMGKPLIEMDNILTERIGMPIADYFAKSGEETFREKESELAKELAPTEGSVIATGGGIIKNKENMRYLSANGLVIWLDRKLELLQGTADRPLSQNASDMQKLWQQRHPLYKQYADIRIEANGASEKIAEEIIKVY